MDSGLVLQDSFTFSAVVNKILTVVIKAFSETLSRIMHSVSMFVWRLNSKYGHIIEDDGFILLKSFKVFDVVGDTFIFKALYHFGYKLK